jgi:transposase InsO family protein
VKLENSATLLNSKVCERLHGTALSGYAIAAADLIRLSTNSSSKISGLARALDNDSTWKDALRKKDNNFENLNGVITYQNRIYVPPPLRLSILSANHDSALAGHFGAAKTIELIQRQFSWPGIGRTVRHYVRGCDSCQRIKTAHHAPYGQLQPLAIPSRPWESISMDFITGLPDSHGNNAIFVVIACLTKQSHFIPTTTDLDATALARLYIAQIIRLHGTPESIISDRGPVFISSFWQSLQHLLGTKLKFSTAYHPQSDGQTERINAILENYLRHYCSYQQDDWADYLPLAEFAYNNASHDATRVSPFYANYGYHPSFSTSYARISNAPAADDLSQRLALIREELAANLSLAQDVAKRQYDQGRSSPPSFQPGDLVMLLRRNLKTTRPTEKLDFRKLGPFKVAKKLSDNVYQLALPPSMSRLHPVFNVNLLERYEPPANFPGRHQHTAANPLLVDESASPGIPIKEFLDVRRIGRRFDYLVDFIDQPISERSWIPLSDIPSTYNEMLERFHRRHPRLHRPADSTLLRTRPLIPSSSPHGPIAHAPRANQFPLVNTNSSTNDATASRITTTPYNSIPTSDQPSSSVHPHPRSPSPERRVPLTSIYVPPPVTTTRSGRRSNAPKRDLITDAITSNHHRPQRS